MAALGDVLRWLCSTGPARNPDELGELLALVDQIDPPPAPDPPAPEAPVEPIPAPDPPAAAVEAAPVAPVAQPEGITVQ